VGKLHRGRSRPRARRSDARRRAGNSITQSIESLLRQPIGRLEFVERKLRNLAAFSRHRNSRLTTELVRTENELILWKMPPNCEGKYLQHLRQFSFAKPSRDTGGSNLPCSARQSVLFAYRPEMAANSRVGGLIRSARGSGERDQSCKSPIRHDSSLFGRDSVPRADFVRSHPDASPFLDRWSLVVRREEARLSNLQGVAAGRPIRSEHRSGSSDARRRGRRLAALHRWIPRLLERAVRAAPGGAHSCR
jgi:hypothetical protein